MFLLCKLQELMKYILGGNNIYQAANRQNCFSMACFDGEEFGKNLNIADVRNLKLEHHFKPSSAVN